MKRKYLHTLIFILVFMTFSAASCQKMPQEASLSLHFDMMPQVVTRSGEENTTVLNYVVEDGCVTTCEWNEADAQTRAGNGNTADGGGMADLNVFLVDKANDNIVARAKISNLVNETSQAINFLNLPVGEYSVYAYANAEGNDWFRMPAENETSFAPYKDALLNSLNDGIPRIGNGRMPLTGMQDITVEGGNNSRTVRMLRPVGKITITVLNERSEAISVETPAMGNILPATGYVFKHNEILPQDNVSNPYYALSDDESHSVVPGSYHVVCETILYESHIGGGFEVSMSYQGADYTFRENLSNSLQQVKQENLLIKLYREPGDISGDRFLKLDQTEGKYNIELVYAHEIDPKCFWRLSSSGRQQRGLTNVFYGMSLNMDDGILSFSSEVQTFKYGGSNDYATIGEGSNQLTYDPATGKFSASDNGSKFQFFTYVEGNDSGEILQMPVRIEDVINNTMAPLTSIYRNQHIRMNIIFR